MRQKSIIVLCAGGNLGMGDYNIFTAIGLFFTSGGLFALVTAIFGGILTEFDRSDWSILAWIIGAIIYGITIAVFCM